MKKKILVAPLNWGLGHATRCIPIINALIQQNFIPIIASDGIALELLRKEFPSLEHVELPSYNINYSKKRYLFKLKLLINSPKVLSAIKAEKKATKAIVETYNIEGIISDNRLGVYHKNIPSVFITHQLQVLSGNTTWFSTKLHQKIIKRYNECWIPDTIDEHNLSGKLGHINDHLMPLKYIGPLSRFSKKDYKIKYKYLILLSGPEPQRSLLEEKLVFTFKNESLPILLVRGVVEKEQITENIGALTIYNYMTSNQLEVALNESEVIICRSGYTTIMDLAKLNKLAFFIPTPGQFEQEYLAKRLMDLKLIPFCNQNDFTLEKLNLLAHYKGLSSINYDINFKNLFSLFKGK